MKTTSLKVQLTFTEPLLGSASNNKDIHEEFIAAKAPTPSAAEEEVDAIGEFQKSMTVFPADDNGLFLWDYQVRGFFKEAIGVLIELGEIKDLSKYAHKKAVDSTLFIRERKIHLTNAGGTIYTSAPDVHQRPLRAETMRGERVALASSQRLPAGTLAKFTVTLLESSNTKTKLATLDLDALKAALDYGALKGLGQWRSGGFGRFTWKELS